MSVTYPRPEVLMLFSVPLYQRLGDVMSACQTAQTNKPVRSMSPNTKPHLEVAVSSRPPPNGSALWGHLCLSVIVFPPDLCSSAYDAGNLSHGKTNKKQWGGDTCLRLHVVFFFMKLCRLKRYLEFQCLEEKKEGKRTNKMNIMSFKNSWKPSAGDTNVTMAIF